MGASSLPHGRKLVQCKWVFWTKVFVDGKTWKYKASLVEKWFSQVQGVDYHETFAPVAKMDSIRLVLAIAASKHWSLGGASHGCQECFSSWRPVRGDIHEES